VGAIRCGNGMRQSGPVTLIGDARIGGGNGGATGFDGAITGPFSLDLGATQTINSNFTLFNSGNDWRGTTTLFARNSATANTIHLGNNEVIPNGVGRGNVIMNAQTSGGSITLDLGWFQRDDQRPDQRGNGRQHVHHQHRRGPVHADRRRLRPGW
jgi:hypothetical protein